MRAKRGRMQGNRGSNVPSSPQRALAWLGLAALAVSLLIPKGYLPDTRLEEEVEHAVAFFAVGGGLAMAFRSALLPALGLVVMAAVMEVLQSLSPGRGPELMDFIYGAAGATAGVALVNAAFRRAAWAAALRHSAKSGSPEGECALARARRPDERAERQAWRG
jgi:VanZ family protein